MLLLIIVVVVLILWILAPELKISSKNSQKKLNEQQQVEYIQTELGLITFTKEDGEGMNENWYPKTREFLTVLPAEEINKKLDKMWAEYPTAQNYPLLLEADILMSDEIRRRKSKENNKSSNK